MIQIKPAAPADMADIRALWYKGFGDEAGFIDRFYRCCCPPEDTFLLREDGAPCSMAAAPVVTLRLPDGTAAQSAYLYALTTDPACRGKGFGQMLLRYADFCLTERQLDCVVLVPAEPSLFQFFHAAGYRPAFFHRETRLAGGQAARPPEGASLRPASAAEYNRVRETLLAGTFHVSYRDELAEFQRAMSRDSGGELYLLELPDGAGCAAVERQGDGVVVKELLTAGGDLEGGISLVAQALPASWYAVRSPAFGAEPEHSRAFGAIKWYHPELSARWGGASCGYLGLAFD